ncbi:hypothetical protein U9M48_027122 [Paspalum notatum var. saurae]|uniref:DUF4220 domain-containing protein n=1 Tax=Paspalum notatum var. saurae TaxID=547442 RepID=A0AAQ3WZ56_PASNO
MEHVQEVWDAWEIQCLILLSLSLQVFLYLTADLRRRSASRTLRMVLWLAYLSADTVAVFALGHLAVHAQGPGHELMFFWAPFVLVHLGGQDNITAFSKQDNELWPRHLLNLVTQAAVAGYVVSKSSWPDARLRAAMVLMFLSGFLKYAGRTYCLYSASPRSLGDQSRGSLWNTIISLRGERERQERVLRQRLEREEIERLGIGGEILKKRFEQMFIADKFWEFKIGNAMVESADDIMAVDAPVNDVETMALAAFLPDTLEEYKNRQDRWMAYQYVAACLPPGWRRTTEQWSEQLAQYSMIMRYTSSMPSLVKWIGAHLGASWCLELFELTRTPVTDDLKLVVLDKLCLEARRKMWDIASFRGERALGQHWHQVFPESERPDCALHKSISSKVDFPTSVLIWHIATDICYFTEDNDTEPAEIKKKKKNSRELSHYIMYLVFKCDVMLTSSSRLVHQKAHEGLAKLLSAGQQSTQIKKETVILVFEGMKKEKQQQRSSPGMAEGNKNEESANKENAATNSNQNHLSPQVNEDVNQVCKGVKEQEQQQGSSPPEVVKGNKNEESTNNAAVAASTSSQILELLRSTEEALYSPVLPDAREVAQELIDIDDEAQRWQLILERVSLPLSATVGDLNEAIITDPGEAVLQTLVPGNEIQGTVTTLDNLAATRF